MHRLTPYVVTTPRLVQPGSLPGGPARAGRGRTAVPVHGARHDAHAFAASGLKDLLARHEIAADLGYTGVDGIILVPFRSPPGGTLHDSQAAFYKDLSALRVAI